MGVARVKLNENRAFLNNHILEDTRRRQARAEAKIKANSDEIEQVARRGPAPCCRPKPAKASPAGAVGRERRVRGGLASAYSALSRQDRRPEAYALNKAEGVLAFTASRRRSPRLFDSKVALAKFGDADSVSAATSASGSR